MAMSRSWLWSCWIEHSFPLEHWSFHCNISHTTPTICCQNFFHCDSLSFFRFFFIYLFVISFRFRIFPFFIICGSLSLAHGSPSLSLCVRPVSMSLVIYCYFFPLFCVQFCLCSVLLSARNQVNCVPKLKSNTTLKYYFKIYTYMYVWWCTRTYVHIWKMYTHE